VIVDFHAHLAPHDPAAPPFLRHLFDVDGYLEHQSSCGIELTVLSYALTDIQGGAGDLDEAKRQHEFLAGICERHAGRFVALATIDPFGGAGWLDEADRALSSGFRGLCLPTSSLGRYLDDEAAQDALAFADERGVVVLLHPSDVPLAADRSGDAILRDWIGVA
jgi:predicted TIM-barrel fold metal-dependent hydrolase